MSESTSKVEKLGVRDRLYNLGIKIDAWAKKDATYGDAMRLGSLMALAGAAFSGGAALGIHEKPHWQIDLALAQRAFSPVLKIEAGESAGEVIC